jgi:LacI family transcriptional regulator
LVLEVDDLEADRARVAAAGFRCTEVSVLAAELGIMLKREPKPLAVLASNDVAAADVLSACLRLGIPVPESVAILGVDDDDLVVSIARPALASIEIPARQLGYEAAALLERLMDGAKPPRKPILLAPTGIIVRASADIFAVDDPDVAEALRFIRENAAEPIRVHDVLAHVALSRRTLERRFVKQLGRTPLAEIHRVHLDRAKRLLIDTDLAIPAVAHAAGFGDDTRFNFMFRRDAGMPPTAYRKKFRLNDRPANKV